MEPKSVRVNLLEFRRIARRRFLSDDCEECRTLAAMVILLTSALRPGIECQDEVEDLEAIYKFRLAVRQEP